MVSTTDSMDMHLSKFQEVEEDRAWRAAVRRVVKGRTWFSV